MPYALFSHDATDTIVGKACTCNTAHCSGYSHIQLFTKKSHASKDLEPTYPALALLAVHLIHERQRSAIYTSCLSGDLLIVALGAAAA
jgi:hypothetical protein